MKQFTLIFALLFSTALLRAQISEEVGFFFGFKGGATYSGISNIKETIIRPVFPESTYNTRNESRFGGLGGIFFYKAIPYTFLSVQPEISFAQAGTNFYYNDVNGLEYNMNFEYQYLQMALLLKIYPLEDYTQTLSGLHLFIGPQFNANVAGNRIMYTSNAEVAGQDLQIQQNLREVLKGTSDFVAVGGIGFEYDRIIIEARYNLGLKDAIETQANGYNFIENKNMASSIQISLGYAIPFDQN